MSARARESWLDRADRIGRRIENALLAIGLGALMLLAAAQILLRNVFSTGIVWGDPLLRILVLWLALLGAIAASRDSKHIAIEIADRILPPALRRVVAVARSAIAAAICAVVAWYSSSFVWESREYGDTLLGDLPAWWFQIVLPVAFALMAYRYLLRAAALAFRRD